MGGWVRVSERQRERAGVRRPPPSRGEECASFVHCCLDYEGGDGLASSLARSVGRSLTRSLGLSFASPLQQSVCRLRHVLSCYNTTRSAHDSCRMSTNDSGGGGEKAQRRDNYSQ